MYVRTYLLFVLHHTTAFLNVLNGIRRPGQAPAGALPASAELLREIPSVLATLSINADGLRAVIDGKLLYTDIYVQVELDT